MRIALPVLLGLSLALAACAPTQSAGGAPPASSASPPLPDAPPPPMVDEQAACNADAAKSLVGQPATQANAERARQLAGARTVRILSFDAVITLEYMYGRLNVVHDADDRIQAIRCG